MKVLYAVVFVLSALAAPALAFDSWPVAAYHLDDCSWDDCSWDVAEQSTRSAPVAVTEPTIDKVAATDDAAITATDDEEDIAVGTIPPSNGSHMVPSTTPALIAASEPVIAKDGDTLDEMELAIRALIDAEDILGEAVEAGGVNQMVPPQLVAAEPTTKVVDVADEVDDIFE